MKKLPHPISEYIRNRFHEGYISHVKTVNNKKGDPGYTVTLNENETVHQLYFDEKGRLIDHSTSYMFEDGHHQGTSHDLGLHGLDDY